MRRNPLSANLRSTVSSHPCLATRRPTSTAGRHGLPMSCRLPKVTPTPHLRQPALRRALQGVGDADKRHLPSLRGRCDRQRGPRATLRPQHHTPDGSRLSDAGGEGSPALSMSTASIRLGTTEQLDAEGRKGSFGAPLPGAPNVGSRVPAKPSRFEHWGVREDLLPTDPRPSFLRSRGRTRRTHKTKTQDLYWFGPPLWCNTLL